MVKAWHVFFGPATRPWQYLMRRGFGHVLAAGYDPDHRMWIFFDPSRTGTMIQVMPEGPACAELYDTWVFGCRPHILRIVARSDRWICPPAFSCVGAIKALLGIRSRALLPFGLYRDLVARGAEKLYPPQVNHGDFRQAGNSEGGSDRAVVARTGGTTR
jgi:hypothetical protein